MNDHIPDLTKMISDTPRTDAAYFKPGATMYDLACEMTRIERELNAANDRIKRLNTEIEQTCGKVLDYPWYKNDQKNFPGSTEVDGVCVGEHIAETIASELARKYTGLKQRIKRLEEELNELRSDESRLLNSNGELERRINRLLEAGDNMANAADIREYATAIQNWTKAKEAKP